MEHSQLWTAVLDTIQEPILVIDRAFRIVSANRAACELVGTPDSIPVGELCHAASHKCDQPCYRVGIDCPVKRVFETGLPARALHQHSRLDGTVVWEEILASPLRDASGAVTFVIEELRDASELLKTREIVDHLQAEVKTLRGVLPICAGCKRIRDQANGWVSVESYLQAHSEADFSHGLCPTCVKRLYPDLPSAKSSESP